VADLGGAQAALRDLCRPFVPAGFVPECEIVAADAVPGAANRLLVHHNHMTVELERFHGNPVDVRVLHERYDGENDSYSRQIGLQLAGTQQIVEWGIARLNFKCVSPQVRDEVLAKQTPLGAILIKHNVHRRIEPRHFLRFPAMSHFIELFELSHNAAPLYGRLGTIYCDDEPAIEVLEIVLIPSERKERAEA
jgi:hypothetical protein